MVVSLKKESYEEQNKITHSPTVQEYPVFDSFVFLFFQNWNNAKSFNVGQRDWAEGLSDVLL